MAYDAGALFGLGAKCQVQALCVSIMTEVDRATRPTQLTPHTGLDLSLPCQLLPVCIISYPSKLCPEPQC